MNQSSSSPPPAPEPPCEDQDLLLDALQGELDDSERRALDARMAADPTLRQESDRLEAFLRMARDAHEVAPDREAALRVALRVRDRVTWEESAARREALRPATGRRRPIWARVLAVSVAAHVLALAVVSWQAHRVSRSDGEGPVRIGLPVPGLPEDDVAWTETRAPMWPTPDREGVSELPDVPELRVRVAPEELALAPVQDVARDHPRSVALEMAVRRFDALKRSRLDRFGLDAGGTLRAVSRGLDALERRQLSDGSFAAAPSRGPVGQTGLALLPFMAEGEGSSTGQRGPRIVARGVDWLRRSLFDGKGGVARAPGVAVSDLGIALRALAEDYMLSYGHLVPADAQRRGAELRALSELVRSRQRPDGSFPGANEDLRVAVWAMWGLEAAIRTGAVAPPRDISERFQDWYATAERTDPHVLAAGLLLSRGLGSTARSHADADVRAVLASAGDGPLDPFWVAVAGSGLLLQDPAAYRLWNEEMGERLLRGLSPRGVVWRGDAVGDTALQLLALQAAYRTY